MLQLFQSSETQRFLSFISNVIKAGTNHIQGFCDEISMQKPVTYYPIVKAYWHKVFLLALEFLKVWMGKLLTILKSPKEGVRQVTYSIYTSTTLIKISTYP